MGGRGSNHCIVLTTHSSCQSTVCLLLCAPQLQFLSSQQQQKAMQYGRNHPGGAGPHRQHCWLSAANTSASC